ncbi:hypothetical protein COBT_001671 [Conglomerata obtusa]
MAEINRSQFVAITPHAWPNVLNMLKWMSDCVGMAESEDVENSNELNVLFYKFCVNGYKKFLEGDESENDDFVKSVYESYGDVFREIDMRQEELRDVERRIEELKTNDNTINENDNYNKNEANNKFNKENLLQKRNEIKKDLESIKERKLQCDEKKKKYNDEIKNNLVENEKLEDEIQKVQKQILSLNIEIKKQKINPEDIKKMNTEKIEMYNELEKMRPVKEKILSEISENEKSTKTKLEEVEKLLYDLQSVRKEKKIYENHNEIIKQNENTNHDQIQMEQFKIEKNKFKLIFNELLNEKNKIFKIITSENKKKLENLFYETQNKLDTLIPIINQEINDLQNEKINLNMRLMEQKTVILELNDHNKHLDNRLLNIGKLYLEKKEIGAIEKRKNLDELNKVEGELMKLNLETNHALLLSEQRLEQAYIKKERLLATVKREREEINSLLLGLERIHEEKMDDLIKICNDKK